MRGRAVARLHALREGVAFHTREVFLRNYPEIAKFWDTAAQNQHHYLWAQLGKRRPKWHAFAFENEYRIRARPTMCGNAHVQLEKLTFQQRPTPDTRTCQKCMIRLTRKLVEAE